MKLIKPTKNITFCSSNAVRIEISGIYFPILAEWKWLIMYVPMTSFKNFGILIIHCGEDLRRILNLWMYSILNNHSTKCSKIFYKCMYQTQANIFSQNFGKGIINPWRIPRDFCGFSYKLRYKRAILLTHGFSEVILWQHWVLLH